LFGLRITITSQKEKEGMRCCDIDQYIRKHLQKKRTFELYKRKKDTSNLSNQAEPPVSD
jgi:hypothetical protein